MSRLPGCTGPCDQGRRLCPTPHACGVSAPSDDDAPEPDIVRAVLTDIALSAVVIAVIALIVMWVAR